MVEFFLRGASLYRGAFREFEPDVVYDNPSPILLHAGHVVRAIPVINKIHVVYRSYAFSCKNHPLGCDIDFVIREGRCERPLPSGPCGAKH
jgi:hypothetical protein